MRKRKFLCIGWLPILLCSLALLAVTLMFEWRNIERNVKASAESSLAAEEFSWAKIQTYNNGRDAVITGAAPNKESIAKAEALASDAYGVREAVHNGEPLALAPEPAPPLESPNVSLTVNEQKVELRGTVADQADIDRLLAAANNKYGAANVFNYLNVGENIKTLDNTGFVSSLGAVKDSLTPVKAQLRDGILSLSGTVATAELSQQIEETTKSSFNGTVNNLLIVPAIVEQDVCSKLVNELLADQKINFESGNSTISAESFPLLNQIVSTANRCPEARFDIEGHTDSVGNANFNVRLSERRAQSVFDYLVNKGLNSSRFTAKGYGANSPIADNSTSKGRAENRRIEFKLKN